MNFFFNIYKKSIDLKIINRIDNYYLNFLCTIVLLFPFFLLTGPFLPDLVIVICALSLIYFILKYNFYNYLDNNFFKFFIFFWIYIVFSSLLSDNLLFSLRSSFFYIRFILFSLFILFLIKNYEFFLKNFFYALTIVFIIVAIDSYFQFYFGKSLTGFEKPYLRLTGPFDDRQIVGSFISRILPLYLFLFLYLYKKFDYKIIVFISLLGLLTLMSGERTAFFLFTFFILAILFMINKNNFKFIFIMVSYIFLTVMIILSSSSLKERLINQTLQQSFGPDKYLNTKSENDTKGENVTKGENDYLDGKSTRGFYIFSRSHEVHYLTAFKMYLDSPYFGQGPNMYRKKCSDKKFFIEQSSCTTHPHNFLLQMLAETGLVGTLFYLFILFIILKKILSLFYETKIKKKELTNYNLKIFIINIGFIVNTFIFILPNGNFFNNYLNALIFIPVGFYLFQRENDK